MAVGRPPSRGLSNEGRPRHAGPFGFSPHRRRWLNPLRALQLEQRTPGWAGSGSPPRTSGTGVESGGRLIEHHDRT